ncbi:Uncharacterised protein [Serratia marcescens]|nr:Uncharacterised protein [Serratia marcescens]
MTLEKRIEIMEREISDLKKAVQTFKTAEIFLNLGVVKDAKISGEMSSSDKP